MDNMNDIDANFISEDEEKIRKPDTVINERLIGNFQNTPSIHHDKEMEDILELSRQEYYQQYQYLENIIKTDSDSITDSINDNNMENNKALSKQEHVQQKPIEKSIKKGIKKSIKIKKNTKKNIKSVEKGVEKGVEKSVEKSVKKGVEKSIEKNIDEDILKKSLEGEIEKRQTMFTIFFQKISVLNLTNDESMKQFVQLITNELNKYIQCEITEILLFKKDFVILNNILEEFYEKPLSYNKKPRISLEIYETIKQICKIL